MAGPVVRRALEVRGGGLMSTAPTHYDDLAAYELKSAFLLARR